MFKKADLIVYVIIALLFCGIFLWINTPGSQYAVIYYHGKEFARYPLKTANEKVDVDGLATIVVSGGKAYFESSTCASQTCVNSGNCRSGQPVICAPNGIILRIEGSVGDVDAITY